MNTYDIVKTVRITEKGARQAEKLNQYTLMCDRVANKTQIRHAVEELFKVKVIRVNTLQVRGKLRRKFSPAKGVTPAWKKAIVTLKEGDKIQLV
jgi:large subunit ribosomal protein L23